MKYIEAYEKSAIVEVTKDKKSDFQFLSVEIFKKEFIEESYLALFMQIVKILEDKSFQIFTSHSFNNSTKNPNVINITILRNISTTEVLSDLVVLLEASFGRNSVINNTGLIYARD